MIEDDIKILSHLYASGQIITGGAAFRRLEENISKLNKYSIALETYEEFTNCIEYCEKDTNFKLWCEKKSKEKT